MRIRDLPTGLVWIRKADEAAVRMVERRRTAALTAAMLPLSFAGTGGLPWIGATLVLQGFDRRHPTVAPVATIAGVWAAAHLGKYVRRRSRPCHGPVSAVARCPDSPSFPSDQAAGAFAGAVVLSRLRPSWTAGAYIAATLTAGSRVYVGAHYPTDVAAGALAGYLGARVATAGRRIRSGGATKAIHACNEF